MYPTTIQASHLMHQVANVTVRAARLGLSLKSPESRLPARGGMPQAGRHGWSLLPLPLPVTRADPWNLRAATPNL